MTTIYIPRLIETAEQAEALPRGTVAYRSVIGGPARYAATRTPSNDWYIGGREFQEHDFMVGWTALVPIEAEEEWTAMGEDSDGDPWIAHVGHGGIDGTREEAEAYVRRFGGFIAHRALTLWEAQD